MQIIFQQPAGVGHCRRRRDWSIRRSNGSTKFSCCKKLLLNPMLSSMIADHVPSTLREQGPLKLRQGCLHPGAGRPRSGDNLLQPYLCKGNLLVCGGKGRRRILLQPLDCLLVGLANDGVLNLLSEFLQRTQASHQR